LRCSKFNLDWKLGVRKIAQSGERQDGERAMMTSHTSTSRIGPELHVFEQAGGWHWGITVPRTLGSGFKVIAYSEQSFAAEDMARVDGNHALEALQVTACSN
jgi:hypothetical protein